MRSKIAANKKWIFVAGIILIVAALSTQFAFAEGEEEVQLYFGVLSLVPPVLAIALAVITKNIVVSLVTSVFVSATIIAGWNPAEGFTSMIGTYMFAALAEDSNMQALFMMTIIAGFVNLLTKSGGANAFTEMVTSKVKSRATCESGIWLGGLIVWFTDTGNSLIVGPIFEALAEKMRVSREKFSYILDCTTSPICSMIPIIGWGVTTIQYIDIELEAANLSDQMSRYGRVHAGDPVQLLRYPDPAHGRLHGHHPVGLRPDAEGAEQSHEDRPRPSARAVLRCAVKTSRR